ncbi:MAG: M28 family peptidase [Acidobacteriota bacterium]
MSIRVRLLVPQSLIVSVRPQRTGYNAIARRQPRKEQPESGSSTARPIPPARRHPRIAILIKADYDNNPSQLLRRSDHWPFMNRGVPGLWFLTGLHPDYHTTYDRPERLNYPKMEKVVRMTHQLLWQLATE